MTNKNTTLTPSDHRHRRFCSQKYARYVPKVPQGRTHSYYPCHFHRRSWHVLTTPLFSNVLFTDLFSIKFLYFFIISSLFLILACLGQYSYNLMLTTICMCRPYIDTNNPQGMKLRRFKNRTPARFEYIYWNYSHFVP
jgi:hypothetical protein